MNKKQRMLKVVYLTARAAGRTEG